MTESQWTKLVKKFKVYKQNLINILTLFSFTWLGLILFWFSFILFVSFHVDELNCFLRVLISDLSKHGFENLLILQESLRIVFVEVEPNFSSEADRRRSFRRNKSKTIEFLGHLEILSH